MLTNSTVTIFRFDPIRGEYKNLGSCAAWVYKQSRTRTDSGGTYSRDIFDVRIPCRPSYAISTDDLICFEQTDREMPDPESCCRIAAVTENRFGSFPHWHIEAENQYR